MTITVNTGNSSSQNDLFHVKMTDIKQIIGKIIIEFLFISTLHNTFIHFFCLMNIYRSIILINKRPS